MQEIFGQNIRNSSRGTRRVVWLGLSVLVWGLPAMAQSQSPQPAQASAGLQLSIQQLSGSISGTVVDPSGAAVAGARVGLTRGDQSLNQVVLSGDNGQFSFADVAPGPFQITITADGFATQAYSGILRSGELNVVPRISLAVATTNTEMRVEPSPTEMAEEQVKDEEKQRVLGVVPNFYVSYAPHAAPLSPKQKFALALRTTVDPVTFALTGASAGLEQAQNHFGGYGQGALGYARRFGANYADAVTGTFIGAAILPSLLKQDPRYFYKGTGSTRSRILYALANAFICKGDNGHWQPSYSGILGSLASGGISNLYYPANDRDGVDLTFENALIGIGASAAANLLQEFLIRRFTTNVPNHAPAKP